MKFRQFFQIALLIYASILGYQNREWLINTGRSGVNYYLPCTFPLRYSLGDFDKRFDISEEKFLTTLARAESVWEEAAGKELFQHVESGGPLQVNLIYDSRQETTNKLQQIDGVISEKQKLYNELVAEHTSLADTYLAQKEDYNRASTQLENLKKNYEQEVARWNKRGGAPESEYARLEEERETINTRIEKLNSTLKGLNASVTKLNQLSTQVNVLIEELNLNVEKFNTTRTANGEEFSEGEYIRDHTGERIDIYEFGSESKLFRVLVHELGHALGMDHVDSEEAIMYRLNAGKSEKLDAADVAELARVCRL
jgi:vacuolar-type H+-ATPase subunit I/STV1